MSYNAASPGMKHLSSLRSRHMSGKLLLAFGVSLSASYYLSASDSSSAQPSKEVLATPAGAGELAREGSRLKNSGVICFATGGRLSVKVADRQHNLLVLENLAAQRILSAILEDPNDQHWAISGFITEFQGRNFLFIEQAVRRKN
ncbi:MAG: hypothetical protein KF752_04155 [Pirellulaceae bacterium]|nr:hypothetical protein [Pirellulaceae bacterium]